jgi:hypothetical protein
MKFTHDEIIVGSHVYHQDVEANGIVVDYDGTKRNQFKVHFPWAKYCTILHGDWVEKPRQRGTKWQWCSRESLTKLDIPIDMGGYGQNKVTTLGKRSLDRLIRLQTGLKKRRPHDGSDIVVNYGTMFRSEDVARFPKQSILLLNRNLVCNKLIQMKMMGEELCPISQTSEPTTPEGDWIIKPFHSIGGKGIRPDDGRGLKQGEYYQRKFNKVREFRVHCFMWTDNPVPFIQEKVIGDKDQLCWNKKQGGKFRYVYQDGLSYGKFVSDLSMASRGMMAKMATAALDKLGYDFGGIDFGMDSTGNFKIFEVNSRMGLRERSFFTYKQVLSALKALNIREYKEKRLNATT